MFVRILAVVVLAVWFAALPAAAQTTAGQITGIIADPTGAVIPGASVAARNAATGVSRQTTSNESGNYSVPLLEPGGYTVTVHKEGFRVAERAGITLSVNSTVRLDFTMTLGTLSESVSVTEDLPLLQPGESSLRSVVDNRKIVELPLSGRNPFDLIFLAPGTQAYRRLRQPGNNIQLSNLSINGGPSMTNEVLLDGIPSTSPEYNQFTIVPSIDAVQEFEVKTNNMAAEFGRSAGGVVNVVMKSGSNQLHGTVYNFLRNDALDSNSWLNNHTGQGKPPFRFNQFGASAGGPIKKDKTFFFGGYEGLRSTTGLTYLFSGPTAEQRAGDFSQTRAQNGQLINIYDPLTVSPAGTGFQRDTFPGNKIPAGRFNTVSRNILPYWPAPNLPGDPVTRINNFVTNKPEGYEVNQTNARIDHSFSNANRIFGRFSWNESRTTPAVLFESATNPGSGPQLFTQRNLAINDTHSFSPTTFATFRIGFTRLRDYDNGPDTSFDATKLGFPKYFKDAQPAAAFPTITLAEYRVTSVGFGAGTIGPDKTTIFNNISNGYTAQSDVTHTRGKHVFKAGFDYRLFRSAGYRPYLPDFTFSAGVTQGPNPLQGSSTAGYSFASFLLGLAGAGAAPNLANADVQSYYYGGFIQDDYKVTPKLTLNLGFRYEIENLRTDRYDRLNVLDFDSPSPLQAPGVGPMRGGLGFVNVKGVPREQAKVQHNASPRIGFAYQLNAKTVLRGGYGIFFGPRTGWQFNALGQTGFSATTPHLALDGVNVVSYYSNPYPNGFVSPTGSSLGLLTNIGGSIAAPDRDQKGMYMQHRNFSVQRQFPGDIGVDLSYAGSQGTHLWQNLQYNQLPDQYLSLKSGLQRVMPNPFLGIIPSTQALGSATTTYGQLLRPYPQFTGLSTAGSSSGSSTYHAVEIRAEKRFSQGLNFLISYTFNKMIDSPSTGRLSWIGDVPGIQNNNDRRSERSLNSQQGPQRLSIAAGYELPIGRGKAFASSISALADKFIGGWQINGIASLQSGIPLALTTGVNNTNSYGGGSRPNSTGVSAGLSGPVVDRLDRYFDTSAFTQPEPFTFGNLSRTLPDVRGPAKVNTDFSLSKNIQLTERIRVQLRGEAFNAFNNTNFELPSTVFGTPAFGRISLAGAARTIQIGLKIIF